MVWIQTRFQKCVPLTQNTRKADNLLFQKIFVSTPHILKTKYLGCFSIIKVMHAYCKII